MHTGFNWKRFWENMSWQCAFYVIIFFLALCHFKLSSSLGLRKKERNMFKIRKCTQKFYHLWYIFRTISSLSVKKGISLVLDEKKNLLHVSYFKEKKIKRPDVNMIMFTKIQPCVCSSLSSASSKTWRKEAQSFWLNLSNVPSL